LHAAAKVAKLYVLSQQALARKVKGLLKTKRRGFCQKDFETFFCEIVPCFFLPLYKKALGWVIAKRDLKHFFKNVSNPF